MEWKHDNKGTFYLYIGKWKVGTVFYSSMIRKGTIDRYQATCSLPGVAGSLGRYKTAREAEIVVEKNVKEWIEKSGLVEND